MSSPTSSSLTTTSSSRLHTVPPPSQIRCSVLQCFSLKKWLFNFFGMMFPAKRPRLPSYMIDFSRSLTFRNERLLAFDALISDPSCSQRQALSKNRKKHDSLLPVFSPRKGATQGSNCTGFFRGTPWLSPTPPGWPVGLLGDKDCQQLVPWMVLDGLNTCLDDR